jgi:hypothetical protein
MLMTREAYRTRGERIRPLRRTTTSHMVEEVWIHSGGHGPAVISGYTCPHLSATCATIRRVIDGVGGAGLLLRVKPCLPALVLCLIMAASVSWAQAVPERDPRVIALLAQVSEERIRAIDERLVAFKTRHTLSDSGSDYGIAPARQWILDELKKSPQLQVSFDTYALPAQGRVTRPFELRNVVAVLPGRSERRIYVTAHYDTVNHVAEGQLRLNIDPTTKISGDPNAPAPGANDDGSGVALTMELARVFASSGITFDATLVFACWAGEEEGHIGSMAHVQKLAAEHVLVEANFNNDIIGSSRTGTGEVDSKSVRVYSEGPEDSPSRALARFVERVTSIYVPAHRIRLMARHDRFGRGSDHMSFNQFRYPAVVFRESTENFTRQHGPEDTLQGVDFAYLTRNARVNAASVASLALAPPMPILTDSRGIPNLGRAPSGYDAKLGWQPSAGAAGYRIYWRDTWTNSWQHSQFVGDVTEYTLPGVSIDDFVFGVAAVGRDRHESLIASYVFPFRPYPEVKLPDK